MNIIIKENVYTVFERETSIVIPSWMHFARNLEQIQQKVGMGHFDPNRLDVTFFAAH